MNGGERDFVCQLGSLNIGANEPSNRQALKYTHTNTHTHTQPPRPIMITM